jgi:hypothetical protein
MAVQTRSVLKTYFETGDKPTSAQFGDLVDSIFAAKFMTVSSTSINAVPNTLYSINAGTSTVTINANALERGESFIVDRGTDAIYANAKVDFVHNNMVMYAKGYADVSAPQDDCMMSYAALLCGDYVLLVNRAYYSI